MKEIKRRVELFQIYDRYGMERHLEKMAEQGWMIEKLTGLFWQYRRIEPANLHFSITFFTKASGFDAVPTPGQREYWDFCHYAGWEMAVSSAQMQIFYSGEEEPMPIETEPKVQLENIRKTMRLQLLMFAVFFVLIIMQLCLTCSSAYRDPIERLSDNMAIANMLTCFTVALVLIFQFADYFLWLRKAKAAAETRGEFYEKTGGKLLQKVTFLLLAAVILFTFYSLFGSGLGLFGFAVFFIPLAFAFFIWKFLEKLKKKELSRGKNIGITITVGVILYSVLMGSVVLFVIHNVHSNVTETDKTAPLRISQICSVKESEYKFEIEEKQSVAAGFVKYYAAPKVYNEDDNLPSLEYRMTTVKLPFLYNLCLDGIFREFEEYNTDWGNGIKEEYKEIDAAPWGAEKVYCRYFRGESQNKYIVCWGNQIAEVNCYFEPTDKQIRTMAEKLNKTIG